MDLPIKCKIYQAKLTERGCRINRDTAIQAARKLINTKSKLVCHLNDIELDRLAGCGRCERCQGGDLSQIYVDAVSNDIIILCERILMEDITHEYDEQQEKVKAAKRKYYEKQKAEKAAK
jgi:hypothetical protein